MSTKVNYSSKLDYFPVPAILLKNQEKLAGFYAQIDWNRSIVTRGRIFYRWGYIYQTKASGYNLVALFTMGDYDEIYNNVNAPADV